MAKVKAKRTGLKKKKKVWFSVISPKSFGGIEIGETLGYDQTAIIGRKITMNLSSVSNTRKQQNVVVSLNINEVKDNKAQTELVGYKLEPAFVKRMARKGKSKISNTFKLKTKDEVSVVIKPVLVTRNKVNRGLRVALFNSCEEYINSNVKNLTFDKLCDSVINQDFQKELKKVVGKVYPLGAVAIREIKKN